MIFIFQFFLMNLHHIPERNRLGAAYVKENTIEL
jgi:hypothetical protein